MAMITVYKSDQSKC